VSGMPKIAECSKCGAYGKVKWVAACLAFCEKCRKPAKAKRAEGGR
jgi:hypothetical protein